MLRNNENLRVLNKGICILLLFTTFFLFYYKDLSFNQTTIVLFTFVGIYATTESIIELKTDSILKRHSILFAVSSVFIIALLAISLVTSSINVLVSMIILAAFSFSTALFFSIVDWTNKRKQK